MASSHFLLCTLVVCSTIAVVLAEPPAYLEIDANYRLKTKFAVNFGVGVSVYGTRYTHNEHVVDDTFDGVLDYAVPPLENGPRVSITDVAVNYMELHTTHGGKCTRPSIPKHIFMKAYASKHAKEYCAPVYRRHCWKVWAGWTKCKCVKDATISMVLFDKYENFMNFPSVPRGWHECGVLTSFEQITMKKRVKAFALKLRSSPSKSILSKFAKSDKSQSRQRKVSASRHARRRSRSSRVRAVGSHSNGRRGRISSAHRLRAVQ